ncbi:MAG: NirD/YgiW/YdeI family stress tolerance protein [Treponema sp.]|nr:NirD/YgiW/YdeI family stress tolerance protein [Treponema sp.]
MKKYFILCIYSLILVLIPAYAQGVTINSPITVNQATQLPHNSWVILNGNIINALPGGINFTFRDPSGDVTVEIDRRVWRGLNIAPSELVQIHGELNQNRGLVSVRARVIVNSETIITRPGQTIVYTYPIPISEARTLPHDSWVILSGNIINVLPNGRHYTFRDSSGEMVVEIDPNVWRGLFINESDTVQITGEIIANRGQPSLVARVIRK